MSERPRREYRLSGIVELAERIAYYGAALFLLVTMGLVFVSAVDSVLAVAEIGLLAAALEILDKVLLIFIFTELLGTINTIVREQEVVAEPFLLIGIIAVVRRILAVTVSIEQSLGTPKFDQLLFELGVLTVLVISLAVSLFFTRRLERPRLTRPNG
ncbi:MAG TPA: phosphate-starvation-inducible PsiE family protein [Rubrobacteraceae bacterium]|nr:phosphate-starvation-inducible PsiE family protein [Rubrobacteraceae bacterium]